MFRFAAAVSAAFLVTACVTTAGGGADVRTFDFNRYFITAERMGCSINNAQIVSRDLTIPFYTYHWLTIGVSGTTSAVYAVNCEPVVAGGKAMCTSNSMGMSVAAATAGIGCGGWNQFNMVRQN